MNILMNKIVKIEKTSNLKVMNRIINRIMMIAMENIVNLILQNMVAK